MTRTVVIDGREIGPDQPPYIICEISGNHGGDLGRALRLIEAAAQTGADAIKLQTYTPDTITLNHQGPGFQIEGGPWDGRSLYDLYEEAHTPFEWHEALFAKARTLGVTIFSSPFDETAVDLLDNLATPAFKIASFEAVDLPLIAYAARKHRPMIISTGMCGLADISAAVETARANGCEDVILLHCISSYPAASEDANVRTIPHLAQTFDCIAGLSDHTFNSVAAIASVALGGCVIEKHFTLSRQEGGSDAAFSLEPEEFKQLVEQCKAAWLALGRVNYDLLDAERGSATFRRSLYAVSDIARGGRLTKSNVRSIRPGHGLAPKHLPEILGRTARCDIKRGQPLSWDLIGGKDAG